MNDVERCKLAKQEILDVLKRHKIGLTFFVGNFPTVEMWDADNESDGIGCTIESSEVKDFEGYIGVS